MPVFRSRRVRLPEFMWQTLDMLAEYANEQAALRPDERIGADGLVHVIVMASVKVELLQALAEESPEYRDAVAAWVAHEIERDPQAEVLFSLPGWSFARKAN